MTQRYIVGDVGGTNDDLAVVERKESGFEILFKQDKSTDRQKSFLEGLKSFLADLEDEFEDSNFGKACFAVAGPVEDRKVQMPNADLTIDARVIEQKTSLETVLLINDFDALGYATELLGPEDYTTVQRGEQSSENQPKAVIGAGTGLGKNLLVYDKGLKRYVPNSSEGGHCDLPIKNREELEMAKFIQELEDTNHPISYEHVLSGKGLENMYKFFNEDSPQEKDVQAEQISETRQTNRCSQKTFSKFIEFYARCCRNYVLDTLPRGGLYIAGGIAAQNPDSIDESFLEEFRNSSPQFQELLSKIPVHVITNYDISLKGAARAMKLESN
ncbi:MAG: glucokinase [Candidatus Nanosalina sp. J07AB43]|nr:MAG: glucokinase [Candidatus Nanosalina sp. J07AB43]